MSEWQPISNAPPYPFDQKTWFKNGPKLLLCVDGHIFIGSYGYTERGKGRWQDTWGRNCSPSHFMSLPPPPEDA